METGRRTEEVKDFGELKAGDFVYYQHGSGHSINKIQLTEVLQRPKTVLLYFNLNGYPKGIQINKANYSNEFNNCYGEWVFLNFESAMNHLNLQKDSLQRKLDTINDTINKLTEENNGI